MNPKSATKPIATHPNNNRHKPRTKSLMTHTQDRKRPRPRGGPGPRGGGGGGPRGAPAWTDGRVGFPAYRLPSLRSTHVLPLRMYIKGEDIAHSRWHRAMRGALPASTSPVIVAIASCRLESGKDCGKWCGETKPADRLCNPSSQSSQGRMLRWFGRLCGRVSSCVFGLGASSVCGVVAC